MVATNRGATVMVSARRFGNATLDPSLVHSVVAHRCHNQDEQYLVRWIWHKHKIDKPYSWHSIHELTGEDGIDGSSKYSCLTHVQKYLEAITPKIEHFQRERSLKRKSSENHQARLSPFDRSRASSMISERSDASANDMEDGPFNCDLGVKGNLISIGYSARPKVDTSAFPTETMKRRSLETRPNLAASKIRSQFARGLSAIPGPPVVLLNERDLSTPSLDFKFIDDYIYQKGVTAPDPATMQGCGLEITKYGTPGQTCRPNMGGNCGCEYTRTCECLEYAHIHVSRLKDDRERKQYEDYENGLPVSTMGLPKKFPYSKDTGFLVDHYMRHRRAIYECNDNCACGPGCKSRVVQRGRQVGLQIFRTKNRGWGLRATEPLQRGQFIDTYRGEVLTREEAKRRYEIGGKGKESYLFHLDKHCDEVDSLYEIDGEYFGGPTRFINHSCEPNCCVYAVSRDKHNPYLYEVAFFAFRDIRAGEELTFDYVDDDGNEEPQAKKEVEDDSIPCLCGTKSCRKWLWK